MPTFGLIFSFRDGEYAPRIKREEEIAVHLPTSSFDIKLVGLIFLCLNEGRKDIAMTTRQEAVIRLGWEVGLPQPVLGELVSRAGKMHEQDWLERVASILARHDRQATTRLLARLGRNLNPKLRLIAAGSPLTPRKLQEWMAEHDNAPGVRERARATLAKRPALVRNV